jgi:hypothetical protein
MVPQARRPLTTAGKAVPGNANACKPSQAEPLPYAPIWLRFGNFSTPACVELGSFCNPLPIGPFPLQPRAPTAVRPSSPLPLFPSGGSGFRTTVGCSVARPRRNAVPQL